MRGLPTVDSLKDCLALGPGCVGREDCYTFSLLAEDDRMHRNDRIVLGLLIAIFLSVEHVLEAGAAAVSVVCLQSGAPDCGSGITACCSAAHDGGLHIALAVAIA